MLSPVLLIYHQSVSEVSVTLSWVFQLQTGFAKGVAICLCRDYIPCAAVALNSWHALKGVQVENRNVAFTLCSRKTGETGLIVGYFQELILWAQLCLSSYVEKQWIPFSRWHQLIMTSRKPINTCLIAWNCPSAKSQILTFPSTFRRYLRFCLLGCYSPHLPQIKVGSPLSCCVSFSSFFF